MEKRVYIGTYTEGAGHHPPKDSEPSRGLYSARFDEETGKLDDLKLAAEVVNPSFLARHPTEEILYVVTEAPVEGFEGGAVHGFRRDSATDSLEPIGRVDSRGLAPCHLVVDPGARFLVVSNYRGGNFVQFPLSPDSGIVDAPGTYRGEGTGPNEKRQEKPHAHSALIDPVTGSVLMFDLGLDTIFVRNPDSGDEPSAELRVEPGSGCRHGVFSRDAKFLYVVGELDSSISVFGRTGDGSLHGLAARYSTLPECFHGKHADCPEHLVPGKTLVSTASAICLHPSGRTLYVSNRGHGSVAVFSVSETNGELGQIQCFETRCQVPRFCGSAPGGRFFLVCGQDNATIDVLRIDHASGRLSETEFSLTVDSPTALLWCGSSGG